MKKITMAFVCGIFFIAAISNNAFAGNKIKLPAKKSEHIQPLYVSAPDNNTATTIESRKKIKGKALKASFKASRSNQKVMDYVNAHFRDISNQVTYSENGGIISRFMIKDRSARAVFDEKGNWIFSIINGTEKDLPKDYSELVKKEFESYSISLVQELQQDNLIVYKVFLQNNQGGKEVFVYNGEITIDKEYTN